MEQQDTTQTPVILNQPIVTEVSYARGMLGRATPGVLNYDGKGNIWLIDKSTNQPVFSQPLNTIKSVKRAEYALYFKIEGKTIAVMFGNALKYAVKSGATANVGVAGLAYSTVSANKMNTESGLETWVSLLQASGSMGANFSPNNITKGALKYGSIAVGILILIVIVVLSIQ